MKKKIIAIIIMALLGLGNAILLYYQQQQFLRTQQSYACIVGSSCESVVGSVYGTTFGIKNELIGVAYYLFIILAAFFSVISKNASKIWLRGLRVSSSLAMVFSLYLLSLQAFVIKTFCFRCLTAITINLILLVIILGIKRTENVTS